MGWFSSEFASLAMGELGPLLATVVNDLANRKTLDKVVTLARLWVARIERDPNMTGAVGAAKRQAAVQGILADLEAEGATIAPVLINLAVEAAVGALKAKAGKAS